MVNNRNSSAAKRARTYGGRREDDWTCPSCGNVNFSFRTTCYMRNCTQVRPTHHSSKSVPKPIKAYSTSSPYVGSAAPSSMYMGVPPYGTSVFNGTFLPSYDVPFRPLHLSGPPTMIENGGIYGMTPPIMERYGLGLPMVHSAMGFLPEDKSQKKDGTRDNDWTYPKFENVNFSSRTVCNKRKCKTPKPGSKGAKSGKNSNMPEGSWKCVKCKYFNYPFRTKCNRQNCGAEKPSESKESPLQPTDENDQETICQHCGDQGFTNAFVYCVKCLNVAVHRYCLYELPKTFVEFVRWVCEDCEDNVLSQLSVQNSKDNGHAQKKVENRTSRNHEATSITKPKTSTNHEATSMTKPKTSTNHEETSTKKPKTSTNHEETSSEKPKTSTNHEETPISKSKTSTNHEETSIRKPKTSTIHEETSLIKSKTSTDHEETSIKLLKTSTNHEETSTIELKKNKKCHESSLSNHSRELSSEIDSSPESKLGGDISPVKANVKRKHSATSLVAVTDSSFHSASSSPLSPNSQKGTTCIGGKPFEGKSIRRPRSARGKPKLVGDSLKVIEQTSSSSCIDDENESKLGEETQLGVRASVVSCSTSPSTKANALNISAHDNHEICRPVIGVIWRGGLNIWNTNYGIVNALVAHLSVRACEKVYEEARLLPSLLHMEMLPKSDLWPNSFITSKPTGDNIALYLFPADTKCEREYDDLVDLMIREELAMRAFVSNGELLVFTSNELPLLYWRFQGKFYIWGVFRGKC